MVHCRATGSTALEVVDNFVKLRLDADGPSQAIRSAVDTIQRLLRHLMVEQGDLFRFEFIQVEDSGGQVIADPLGKRVELLKLTVYDLPELSDRLLRAGTRASLHDDQLERALMYYEHARLLYNLRGHVEPLTTHNALLVASSYLHLWKALTTILGEPGTDRDYQRRFREYGFEKEYWTEKVAPLKQVRDRSDVAHYSLDPEAVAEVERSFGKADGICREVIKRYADHLGVAAEEEAKLNGESDPDDAQSA